jgi:hypothetical protein
MAWAASAVDLSYPVNTATRSRRTAFEGFAIDIDLAATDTGTVTLKAGKANHRIFVTRIVFSVLTSAAQALSIQDSATTPVVIAKHATSPALGAITWDFGEDGTPLTEGKDLVGSLSGAGLAGRIHVEGYLRRVSSSAA